MHCVSCALVAASAAMEGQSSDGLPCAVVCVQSCLTCSTQQSTHCLLVSHTASLGIVIMAAALLLVLS